MRVAIYVSSMTGERLAVEHKAHECRKFAHSKGWQIDEKHVCISAEGDEESTLNSLIDEAQADPRPFDGVLIFDPDCICVRPRGAFAILQRFRDLGIGLIFVNPQSTQPDGTNTLQQALDAIFRHSKACHDLRDDFEGMAHRSAQQIHDLESAIIRYSSLALSILNLKTSIRLADSDVEHPNFKLDDLPRLFPRGAQGTAEAARNSFVYMQAKIYEGRSANKRNDDRAKERVYKELESFACPRSKAREFIEGRLCRRYPRKLLEEYLPLFFPGHNPKTIIRYFDRCQPTRTIIACSGRPRS